MTVGDPTRAFDFRTQAGREKHSSEYLKIVTQLGFAGGMGGVKINLPKIRGQTKKENPMGFLNFSETTRVFSATGVRF